MARKNYFDGTLEIAAGLELQPTSSPPTGRSVNDVYLDDGTNTTSGNPGWRYLVSTGPDVWADVSGGGGGGGGGESVGAANAVHTMGDSAFELVIGQTTYDGSSGASHTFKAIIEPGAAVTCEVRLYDRGPVAGPPVAAQLVSKLITSVAGLQVLSLPLTASAGPSFPDNDEIYNTDRMYEVRAYISGTIGDVLYVGKVTLAGA